MACFTDVVRSDLGITYRKDRFRPYLAVLRGRSMGLESIDIRDSKNGPGKVGVF